MNEDNVDIELPDIFPQSNVNVEEEPHIFDVKEGSLEDLKKLEYTLNKAPIYGIKRVTGTRQGSEYTFEKGVDYELSNDANRLIWLENNLPDDNTEFYVTYQSESIISRYISSSEKELEISEEHINEVIDSKFVSTAEGDELDELGKLFGPTIGQRRGRNDEEYRVYLRSVVQSFTSRGTKTGIKLAISAATDIPIEDIEIIEDFRNNEYSIGILPQTPVAGTLLEDVAEIADPSGIKQLSTRYRPEPDETVVDDNYSITEGNLFTEVLSIDSLIEINPNVTTTTDKSLIDDDKSINANLFETSDGATFDDAVSDVIEENTNQYKWSPLDRTVTEDTGNNWGSKSWGAFDWKEGTTVTQDTDDNVNWNFFEWIELEDLFATIAGGTGGSTDGVRIDQNKFVVPDTGLSDDGVRIDQNKYTFGDTAKVDDSVQGITEENPDAYRWGTRTQTIEEPTGNNWNSDNWSAYEQTVVEPTGDNWGAENWNTLEWSEGTAIKSSTSGTFVWAGDTDIKSTATGQEWDFFQWNELVDIGQILVDGGIGGSDDAVIINPNKLTVDGGIGGSDDAVTIDPRTTTTVDTTGVNDSNDNNVTARTTHEWAQYEQTVIDATGDDWDSDNWSAYEQTVVEPTGDEWGTEHWNTLEWVESGTIESSTSGTFVWAGDTDIESGASGKEWDFFEWRQPA